LTGKDIREAPESPYRRQIPEVFSLKRIHPEEMEVSPIFINFRVMYFREFEAMRPQGN
jgi:hypothetical protein